MASAIAYVTFRAMFLREQDRVDELTRKLALRIRAAREGRVGMSGFMDAYIEWLAHPGVLFFIAETRRRVHLEFGGAEQYKLIQEQGLTTSMNRKFALGASAELNQALREKASWGNGRFWRWLLWPRQPLEIADKDTAKTEVEKKDEPESGH